MFKRRRQRLEETIRNRVLITENYIHKPILFPLPLHIVFCFLALVTSVIFPPSLRRTKLRWFSLFLLLILLIELTARYLRRELGLLTGWLYNFSIPLEYLFYIFLVASHITHTRARQLAWGLFPAFAILCICINVANGIRSFNPYLIIAGNLAAVIVCFLYFFSLFYSMERINLLQEPMFWITSGLLLFNAGELLYSVYYPVLREKGWDKSAKLFRAINNNLTIILYTSYITGFLCMKMRPRYQKE